MFYFVLLFAEKLTGFPQKLGVFAHIYALAAIVLGWAMFRAETFSKGVAYWGMMFGYTPFGFADNTFWYYFEHGIVVLFAAILLSLPILPWLREKAVWQRIEPFVMAGVFGLSLLMVITATYSPFIYFNF